MKPLRFEGSGLACVYLVDGYTIEGEGDDQTIAYRDIDGLYQAIAASIARRTTALTGAELRFLRKRLGWSQREVAALGGKTDQAVAKWEKEQTPAPLAESNLIRLAWLAEHASKRELVQAVSRMTRDRSSDAECGYVMAHRDGKWVEDEELARMYAQREANAVFVQLLDSVKVQSTQYTDGKGEPGIVSKVSVTKEGTT